MTVDTLTPMESVPPVEIDGRPASVGQLQVLAQVNFGHYTSMQVRGGRVRGLEFHLARLAGGNLELFGADLDPDEVRRYVRQAVGPADASVRVTAFAPETGSPPSIVVGVQPPADASAEPLRLHVVAYQRPVPHLKHVGTFAQIYHGRAARAAGFDDALLTTSDSVVTETTVANVGFLTAGTVVWPNAPILRGTGMQLLERRLAETGWPAVYDRVRVRDLGSIDGAFVVNSRGVAAVCQIDDGRPPVHEATMARLTELYETANWDPI
jgi:branched-subunit amino acid aminotransferase/4-amino-4-deoxychorismate lyase